MEPLINGLFLHEVILLGMGIVLFCASLFAFLYLIIHRRTENKTIPALLVIAIIMIAFPTIKKFEISGLIAEMDRTIARASTDSTAKETLRQSLIELGDRPITSGDDLLILARANSVLGDAAAALRLVDSSLKADAGNPEAARLQTTLVEQHVAEIGRSSAALTANPGDSNARRKLERYLSAIGNRPMGSPYRPTIDRGYRALQFMPLPQADTVAMFHPVQ